MAFEISRILVFKKYIWKVSDFAYVYSTELPFMRNLNAKWLMDIMFLGLPFVKCEAPFFNSLQLYAEFKIQHKIPMNFQSTCLPISKQNV